VQISNGVCQIIDSIRIDLRPPIYLNLQNDTTICEDLKGDLIVKGPLGFNRYEWQPGNILTTDIIIQMEGKYYLKVYDNNNCSAIDSIHVLHECPLSMWIPTVFSPTGNYSNSRFGVVYDGPPVLDFELLIFNHWGELIFKSNDINAFWDGSYLGNPCQLGMYLCIVNLKAGSKNEATRSNYKGMFYLNR